MDFRAVLILLCVLCMQARCKPVGSRDTEGALNATIQLLLPEIRSAVVHLNHPELLPNTSCSSLNISQLLGLNQEPFSARNLSSVRCFMQELSGLIVELSSNLTTCAQFIQAIEVLVSDSPSPQSCQLPAFDEMVDAYVFTKCFLQLVEEKLGKLKL